jgi:hypothetical protein
MGIKLDSNDVENVVRLHNAITNAMLSLPHEILCSSRYGAWVVTAIINILYRVLKMMNLGKIEAHQLLDDIWDNKNTTCKILN